MTSTECMVSVLCTAYNHEKYIRQCLDGFVAQKTTFPFEVLVNDDASTDHTAEIIREYEEKYPDIIKPIYQTENQYSRCKDFQELYDKVFTPGIRGKYVALCEGDDFWVDPYKLQKQVDFMEAHPECYFCTHRVQVIGENGQIGEQTIPPKSIELVSGVLKSEDAVNMVIKDGGFHTSSYFFNADAYIKLLKNPPKYVDLCDVGDVKDKLYFSSIGNVGFIDEIMSYYRSGGVGSWSMKMREQRSMKVGHYRSMIAMYECFDQYTDYRFHDACVFAIKRYTYGIAQTLLDYRTLVSKEYKEFWRNLTRRVKLKYRLGVCFPHVIRWYDEKRSKKIYGTK